MSCIAPSGTRMTHDFELDKAALLMVEALYIAAMQGKETAVADYLEDPLDWRHLKSQRSAATLSQLRRDRTTPRPITNIP